MLSFVRHITLPQNLVKVGLGVKWNFRHNLRAPFVQQDPLTLNQVQNINQSNLQNKVLKSSIKVKLQVPSTLQFKHGLRVKHDGQRNASTSTVYKCRPPDETVERLHTPSGG